MIGNNRSIHNVMGIYEFGLSGVDSEFKDGIKVVSFVIELKIYEELFLYNIFNLLLIFV